MHFPYFNHTINYVGTAVEFSFLMSFWRLLIASSFDIPLFHSQKNNGQFNENQSINRNKNSSIFGAERLLLLLPESSRWDNGVWDDSCYASMAGLSWQKIVLNPSPHRAMLIATHTCNNPPTQQTTSKFSPWHCVCVLLDLIHASVLFSLRHFICVLLGTMIRYIHPRIMKTRSTLWSWCCRIRRKESFGLVLAARLHLCSSTIWALVRMMSRLGY